jgi:hypothetical protein
MKRSLMLLAVLAVTFTAVDARGQSTRSTDRVYVNVSGWYQAAPTSFTGVVTPIDFVERASIDTSYRIRSAAGFDVGGGVRVWRHLGVGLDVSRFTRAGGGSVTAQVPHPFYFNRLRPVTGDAPGLEREETGVHAQVLWMLPIAARWEIGLSGGPSWFNVGQDLVQTVTITESYPYDTATFAGITSARRTGSRVGFNAGGDIAYRFNPRVGVGLTAGFSRARVPLGDTVTINAGGAHVGGGLRLRF